MTLTVLKARQSPTALNKRSEKSWFVHQEVDNTPFIHIPGISLIFFFFFQHVNQMFSSSVTAALCFHSSLVSAGGVWLTPPRTPHIPIFSLQHLKSASTVVYFVQISFWETAHSKGMCWGSLVYWMLDSVVPLPTLINLECFCHTTFNRAHTVRQTFTWKRHWFKILMQTVQIYRMNSNHLLGL